MRKIFSICIVAIMIFIAGCLKDNNPTSVVGAWIAGNVTLQLTSNNLYIISDGAISGSGKYTVSGTDINFTETSTQCNTANSTNPVGKYSFYIYTTSSSGGGYYSTPITTTYMTLTLINDSCSYRSAVLPVTYTN